MKKIGFVFSGQGSQYTGMGKEFYDNFASVKALYEIGSEVIKRDLKSISFDLDTENLSKTINSQPAIFTLSLSSYIILKENGIIPSSVAGFSLGECSALAAADCVNTENGFKIISQRSISMQKASEEKGGSMYAVLGLNCDIIKDICLNSNGYCECVNFNCPGQTVIAGDNDVAEKVAEACLKAGASKAIKLAVSAAFHSKLMSKASKEFEENIKDIKFKTPSFPLYSNVDGKIIDDFNNMPNYLKKQMTSPVMWIDIIENMINDGITDFVELGAGKTLCGLIRKISRDVNTYNVEDIKSLTKALEGLR